MKRKLSKMKFSNSEQLMESEIWKMIHIIELWTKMLLEESNEKKTKKKTMNKFLSHFTHVEISKCNFSLIIQCFNRQKWNIKKIIYNESHNYWILKSHYSFVNLYYYSVCVRERERYYLVTWKLRSTPRSNHWFHAEMKCSGHTQELSLIVKQFKPLI